MILERVRNAGPRTRSAWLFASSLSFVIHWTFFMACFGSSLSSIFRQLSRLRVAECHLLFVLLHGLVRPLHRCVLARPHGCNAMSSRKLRQRWRLLVLASCIPRVVLVLRRCCAPPRSTRCPPVLPLCPRRVLFRSSCAFCSVLLGVSLASMSSALAALLESMAHPAAIDGPSTSATAELIDCFA